MHIKDLNIIFLLGCLGTALVSTSSAQATSYKSKGSSHQGKQPCYSHFEMVEKSRPAFVKFISGASFSQEAKIKTDPKYWDPAIQGYNSRLGKAGIIGIALGYEFYSWLAGDISLLHQSKFKYSKFQTPVANLNTPNPLPSKTRHFDLESTSVMFDARLLGKGLGLSLDFNKKNYIAPFLGGGIGLTYHKVSNFFSNIGPTALTPSVSGASSIGSGTVTTTALSYQFEAGLQYKHDNTWGASIGYRWFDGGKFKGPNHIIAGTGAINNPIVGVVTPPWKGRLQNHQIFAEISYNF